MPHNAEVRNVPARYMSRQLKSTVLGPRYASVSLVEFSSFGPLSHDNFAALGRGPKLVSQILAPDESMEQKLPSIADTVGNEEGVWITSPKLGSFSRVLAPSHRAFCFAEAFSRKSWVI